MFSLLIPLPKGNGDENGNVFYVLCLKDCGVRSGEIDCWGALARKQTPHRGIVILHTEIVIPLMGSENCDETNFGIFALEESGYRGGLRNADEFFNETMHRWLAVPVYGDKATTRCHEACNKSVGIEYSYMRYVTAYFRPLARFVPDNVRSAAHCATLTARVVKASVEGVLLRRPSSYSPTTLYADLLKRLGCMDPKVETMSQPEVEAVNCLLHKADNFVQELGDEQSILAINALSRKVIMCETFGDDDQRESSQKHLATALLRWSISRRL
jgi:hypothetical protein